MAGEAKRIRDGNDMRIASPAAAVAGGEIHQMPDGCAGYLNQLTGIAASEPGAFETEGIVEVAKSTSQVFIDGAPLWWDHSANEAVCVPPIAGDRDFFLGTCVGDVAAATATCKVNLNKRPVYEIDLQRDGGDVAVVLTSGTPTIFSRGGSLEMAFSATAEAQKLDWLSKRSFALASNWIFEAEVEVVTNADADVADLNVGVANATHASDADSITESAFFHFDMGGDLNLDAESDDGTTEVSATDTTVDWAVGTRKHLVIDGRDPTDLHFYVDGVEVLNATTFDISAATGPLKVLLHLEKSSNDSPGVVHIDGARIRTSENAAA